MIDCMHRTSIPGTNDEASWCEVINMALGWQHGLGPGACALCVQQSPRLEERATSALLREWVSGAAAAFIAQGPQWRAQVLPQIDLVKTFTLVADVQTKVSTIKKLDIAIARGELPHTAAQLASRHPITRGRRTEEQAYTYYFARFSELKRYISTFPSAEEVQRRVSICTACANYLAKEAGIGYCSASCGAKEGSRIVFTCPLERYGCRLNKWLPVILEEEEK